MTEQLQKAISEIAHRHGLHYKTVEDLLLHGWTYTDEINKPPRWEKIF